MTAPSGVIRKLGIRGAKAAGILIAMLLALKGCAYLLFGRGSNIHPGERDYPKENPHPSHVVELVGTMPSSMEITIEAMYEASPYAKDCFHATGGGTTTAFSVVVPVPTRRSGNEYTATIVVDRFLPGRCGWQLSAVGPHLAGGEPDADGVLQTGAGHLQVTPGSHIPLSGDDEIAIGIQRADVWCGVYESVYSSKQTQMCLDFLEVHQQWPAAITNPRSDGMAPNSTAAIYEDTSNIRMNFYDLGALIHPRK